MGAVVPRSLMSKQTAWHTSVLNDNTLDGVIVLPDELFAPYASSYTVVLMMTKGIKHKPNHEVFFCRIENDGFRRRKSVRVHTEGEQLSLALDAYEHRRTIPGFCGWSVLIDGAGWDAGYYIPARPLSEQEINAQSAALTRNAAAFVVAHSPELVALNDAIARGEFTPIDYHSTKRKKKDVEGVVSKPSVISSYFHIYYGQKSLHNKDGLTEGKALVISSSGVDNGCYGFFDFPDLIRPPFVTVPSTGSIGRAHVQKWPCGVTDDCLVLVPKEGVTSELLYVAAAVVRQERWRFNYGRKITPERIANYPVPNTETVLARVREHIEEGLRIEQVALEIAEDTLDSKIAAERLEEIEQEPAAVLSGDVLEEKMKLWLSSRHASVRVLHWPKGRGFSRRHASGQAAGASRKKGVGAYGRSPPVRLQEADWRDARHGPCVARQVGRLSHSLRVQAKRDCGYRHRPSKGCLPMNKTQIEPDDMRMPADKFDEMMRHALGAPPPSEQPKTKPGSKAAKPKKDAET